MLERLFVAFYNANMNYLHRRLYFTGPEICRLLGVSRQNLHNHLIRLDARPLVFNCGKSKLILYFTRNKQKATHGSAGGYKRFN